MNDKLRFLPYFFLTAYIISYIHDYIAMHHPVSSTKPYIPSLFIAIICSNKGCKRAKHSYNDWGKEMLSKYPDVRIKYLTVFENDTERSMTLVSKNKHEKIAYRQLYYDNYKGYSYFMTKTNKDWIFRTTEDVFVHIDNFISLLRKIEIQNQGRAAFVGEIISTAFFAHGGPGWIMNRNATNIWMREKNHFDAYFNFHYNVGDDVIIDEYQRISMIPKENMHTNLFFGYPITDETQEILTERRWDKFGECPPINPNITERARVRDVAVWHSGTASNYAALHGREIIREAPYDLYMIQQVEETSFCFMKDKET